MAKTDQSRSVRGEWQSWLVKAILGALVVGCLSTGGWALAAVAGLREQQAAQESENLSMKDELRKLNSKVDLILDVLLRGPNAPKKGSS